MMEPRDLHWAAGFIEGEGHFSGAGLKTGPHTGASSTDLELLVRLQRMFGGSIYQRKPNPLSKKIGYDWRKYGVGVMMTLYSLLGTRRKAKIVEIITRWKSRPQLKRGRPRKEM